MTIYGHFFINHIDSFYKTEVQGIILSCSTCQNLNWIKSYDKNTKGFIFVFFTILNSKKLKIYVS